MLAAMTWAEDTSALFRDFGVTVTHGARTARAILDQPTTAMLGGLVNLEDYQLTLDAADLPDLAHGETVTIAGASYLVREVLALDDGALKRVTLRLV
jgi:hypothetical protein